MNENLILATRGGVVVCERDEDLWVVAQSGLGGQEVTAVAVSEGAIVAGTRRGIFLSEDFGYQWREHNSGLSTRYIRWLSDYPDAPGLLFAGVEPAGIFISYEGGRVWRSCPEVSQLRDRHGWRLPYSDGAGCVRGFAFHRLRGYAAVEDGAVLVSNDSGETWRLAEGSRGDPDHTPAEGFVHSDVHSIEVHASSGSLVLAPTGGGLYRSEDGGQSWERLYACYCRAAWWDPDDPLHIIFGPADGVDFNGRIEESRDGGRSWQAPEGASDSWNTHMVERFVQAGNELLAVLSNGELLSASLDSQQWQPVMPELKGVTAAVWVRTA